MSLRPAVTRLWRTRASSIGAGSMRRPTAPSPPDEISERPAGLRRGDIPPDSCHAPVMGADCDRPRVPSQLVDRWIARVSLFVPRWPFCPWVQRVDPAAKRPSVHPDRWFTFTMHGFASLRALRPPTTLRRAILLHRENFPGKDLPAYRSWLRAAAGRSRRSTQGFRASSRESCGRSPERYRCRPRRRCDDRVRDAGDIAARWRTLRKVMDTSSIDTSRPTGGQGSSATNNRSGGSQPAYISNVSYR